jgi:C4-type Zn-finger protein
MACPVCGEMMGSHEAGRDFLWTDVSRVELVCQSCDGSMALRLRNIAFFESYTGCITGTTREATEIYTKLPGEALCPSCTSLLNYERRRLELVPEWKTAAPTCLRLVSSASASIARS